MISYKERLNHITTFIFDIDGVLTNGDILVFHDEAVRILNNRDGFAMHLASKLGYKLFVISGGKSEPVKKKLLEIGVHEVHLGASNKVPVYQSILEQHGLTDQEVLYMGDDIPDIRVMQLVGCATCPQDACHEVKSVAHYQSPFNGGKHAVRDVIEQTLRVQGKWLTEESYVW